MNSPNTTDAATTARSINQRLHAALAPDEPACRTACTHIVHGEWTIRGIAATIGRRQGAVPDDPPAVIGDNSAITFTIAAALERIAVAVEQLVQAPTSDPFAGKALTPDACPTCGHGSLWHDNGGTGPCCRPLRQGPVDVLCDCPGPPTTTVETTDA